MTTTHNNISGPYLTAFVLGELSAEEAAEVRAALEKNPALQAEADDIRQVAAQIETAMLEEDGRRQTADGGREPASVLPSPKRRFRWFLPAAMTAIAASLVVAFVWSQMATQQIARQKIIDQVDAEIAAETKQFSEFEKSSKPKSISAPAERLEEQKTLLTAEDSSTIVESTDGMIDSNGGGYGSSYSSGSDSGGYGSGDSYASSPYAIAPHSSSLDNRTAETSMPTRASRSAGISLATNLSGMGGGYGGMSGGYGGGMGGGGEPSGWSARSTQSGIEQKVFLPHPIPRPEPRPPREESYNHEQSKHEQSEAYKEFTENEFQPVKVGEFSTFSIDVDTASYSAMRRYVNEMNRRPPKESVRLEEFINYFKYDYPQPEGNKPFAAHIDVFPCPWQPKHQLARIGIKGKEYTIDERPPLHLVFLIDVSGSMSSSNRLPLVQKGLTDLVEMLQPKDRVAIVTYAGESRLVLPSVSGQEKRAILDSIHALSAGGSTAGAAGIQTAYETARTYYNQQAQNRVILCTDGDFNVGETNNKTLEEMIGDEAKSGVFLSILGFGMGNYKDDRLKTLSMHGNGNYGYIDSAEECQRLLVEGLTRTLFTIAKDVKIQIDFNPAKVAGYRLLGYENRQLRDEDFHHDAVDAGEIGAGHTVTALYEIVPFGETLPTAVDSSRYAAGESEEENQAGSTKHADEWMFVKLRYKEPDRDQSVLLEYPVKKITHEANSDSQFVSAVALYSMLLRSSRHSGTGTWNMVLELATPNVNEDPYRQEFVELVKKAKELR